MQDLRNKVAVVTGASSGIGRALALELAGLGAELALSDVDEAGLEETVGQVRSYGAKVSHERIDVAERGAMHAWSDRVVEQHGRANLIINNAGVALSSTIEDMSYDDLEWLMGINFWGVVHGTKAFLPHLIASGDGHIVNISSVFGIIGVPGQGAYNAAKFAVRGYTECLRQELAIDGHPVSATCVHPGGIKTNIARNGRVTTKEGAPSRQEMEEMFDRAARTTPRDAAKKIIGGIKANKRRVLIGLDAQFIDKIQRIAPTGYQALLTAAARRVGGTPV
jgi:NAD(P)-dependent dehydrogenase (short-subunit alcohol dehydrogenase family)